jgi:hypothetical protein
MWALYGLCSWVNRPQLSYTRVGLVMRLSAYCIYTAALMMAVVAAAARLAHRLHLIMFDDGVCSCYSALLVCRARCLSLRPAVAAVTSALHILVKHSCSLFHWEPDMRWHSVSLLCRGHLRSWRQAVAASMEPAHMQVADDVTCVGTLFPCSAGPSPSARGQLWQPSLQQGHALVTQSPTCGCCDLTCVNTPFVLCRALLRSWRPAVAAATSAGACVRWWRAA